MVAVRIILYMYKEQIRRKKILVLKENRNKKRSGKNAHINANDANNVEEKKRVKR